ncbi:sialate O-acetylesterase [Pedobacter psychroterrae]|uniref:9-O-acetylesterase n=1 Tax=Pedobacter psychroterrae TaxID=2530453 RepID=A0A4R0NHM0_9SPHI|nr:sialate O-acetylesterase [Pedobacter psychroterrae]TCD00082.1 9-O-acetylesterase [Pedobacter psychroterrae]
MNIKRTKLLSGGLLLGSLFLHTLAEAKVVLPSVFSDNMVFQQKTNAPIWGKADAGKTITIKSSWNGKTYTGKADANGNFKVMLATPAYGGPYSVTISDGETTTLNNVLIGDVWICSGQSNMEQPLAGWGKVINYEQEIKDANYPKIRLLQGVHVTSNTPLDDAKVTNGGWTECNPKYIAEFSAVAYFFAREVTKKTGIPIGLIHTSWGGTIAEAWTSAETLNKLPDFVEAVKQIQNADKGTGTMEQKLAAWSQQVMAKDAGIVQGKPLWVASSTDVASWKTMSLPVLWEDAGMSDFDGVVWFRKNITIPQSWEGKSVKVNLGAIDDNDVTFFDGEKIGNTEGFNVPRSYTISGNKVKAGTYALVVRIFDGAGSGGIYPDNNNMSIVAEDGPVISLNGDWKYQIGLSMKDVPPPPAASDGPNRTTVLYNAMIHPYIQFPIKGAIWYQGESNAGRANQYRTLFPAMITDWRTKWGIGDFPFYFVQLANFMAPTAQPVNSEWAELRDAQKQTLSLKNTGMAVIIDAGEEKDIHPKNKQDVGIRLAYAALAKTYGLKIPFSGPVYQSQQISGKTITLSFTSTDGGLKIKNGTELKGFEIAGADQKFHWANATIQGNKVIVSSDEVASPVAVRYAWANNPPSTLYNGADLPASPFKTDNWRDITAK